MRRVGVRIVAALSVVAALLAVAGTAQAQPNRHGQGGGGRGRSTLAPNESPEPAPQPKEQLAPGEYSLDIDQALEALNRGEGRQALAFYERASVEAERQGDRVRAARASHCASSVAARLGIFQKAIVNGTRAIELYKAAGLDSLSPNDLGRLGSVYSQTGGAYRMVGDLGQARKVLEEGIAFADSRLSGRREAVVTGYLSNGLALVAYHQRDYQTSLARAAAAAQSFEDAVLQLKAWAPERRRTQIRRRAAQSLVLVAKSQLALGHREEADAAFDRALKYARLTNLREEEVEVLQGQGNLALARQEWAKAETLFRQGIVIAGQINRPVPPIWLNQGLSRALTGLGRPDEALAASREAVRRVEQVRGELGDSDLRSTFLEDKQGIYHNAVRVALLAKRPDEAFELAERSRARAFLDLLGTQTTLSKGKTRALVEEEVRLRERLAEAQARAESTPDDAEAPSISTEAAERDYRAFLERVRKENLEQASLMTVEPVTMAEIQRLLPEGTTLLEYLVQDDEVIVWVVDRAHATVVRTAGDRQSLVAQVRRFRSTITTQGPLASVQEHAQALYGRLVEAARSEIHGDRLLIVPHGTLHYLPFSALRSPDGHWLVESFAIGTLPSASVLRYLADKSAGASDRALVVGNPDIGAGMALRWAEREAKMVGERERDATVLVRADATEARVKKLIETVGFVHFATHGELNESDPLASALLLTPGGGEDGRLEVRELFGLDLHARLVVLSACQTGLGRLSHGDELVGLQRAFIYAGTPAVVTTLWKVDDRASYELVRAFYERLEQVGAVQALRQAQLETMRRFPHPFAWAAFGLTGVPR